MIVHRGPSTPFNVALAEYAVDLLDSDDLPKIAECAVLEGIESPILAALAGAGRGDHPADLRDTFQRGLAQAGLGLPEPSDAAVLVIHRTTRDVLDEVMTVDEAVLRLKRMFDLLSECTTAITSSVGELKPLRDAVWSYYYGDDESCPANATALRAACHHMVTIHSPSTSDRSPYR